MRIPQTTASTPATVSLLDFEGRFLDGRPILGATEASVRFVAANVCADCVGSPAPSHLEGLVAFDLAAAFERGEAAGRVVATHCDSMDLGAP
jgi:hypothetical protein